MPGLLRPVAARGTLRVLAALLSYPDGTMRGHLPEMRDILRDERALTDARRAELDALIDVLARADQLEVEADYVELFDRGRGTSLHLFEHVHGDSRERGPAMIDLAQTYEKAGLYLALGELPDYLPAVLEFVSTQPPARGGGFSRRDGAYFHGHIQRAEGAHKSLCKRAGRAHRTCWRKSRSHTAYCRADYR